MGGGGWGGVGVGWGGGGERGFLNSRRKPDTGILVTYKSLSVYPAVCILSDLAFLHELKTLHRNTNDANTHFIE